MITWPSIVVRMDNVRGAGGRRRVTADFGNVTSSGLHSLNVRGTSWAGLIWLINASSFAFAQIEITRPIPGLH